MEIGETWSLYSRQEWRDWLIDHHRDKREILLVLYRSTSGKRPITLREAMDEALCFGCIDATRYALRFSPRQTKSPWSDINKARALALLWEGKMAPAGRAPAQRGDRAVGAGKGNVGEGFTCGWESGKLQQKGANLCVTRVKK